MLSLQDVTTFLFENFQNITITNNGCHFHCRCPLCGDSKQNSFKKRFHLNFKYGSGAVYHCFNCGKKGNFYKLYSIVKGVSRDEAYKFFQKIDTKTLKREITSKILKTNDVKQKTENFNWIRNDCVSINDDRDGIIINQSKKILKKFIEQRRIKQPLFYAFKGRYQGRIIIPIMEYKNIIYFQGRTICDQEPKYLNPIVEKQGIILNKNNFRKDKYIAITEGIIDAWSIGNQGTSMLGKSLNQKFVSNIQKLSIKTPILVMDNDETGFVELQNYIKIYKKQLLYFLMPEKYKKIKDLNELLISKNINSHRMYNFVIENSHTAPKVKMLIQSKNQGEKWK